MRAREEVLRQRVEDYDADAGVADMLNDYQEAQYTGGCMDDEPEPTAKAFYDSLQILEIMYGYIVFVCRISSDAMLDTRLGQMWWPPRDVRSLS